MKSGIPSGFGRISFLREWIDRTIPNAKYCLNGGTDAAGRKLKKTRKNKKGRKKHKRKKDNKGKMLMETKLNDKA